MAERTPFIEPVHPVQGALRSESGEVQWRLWAPLADEVRLVLFGDSRSEHPMQKLDRGYHVFSAKAAEGVRYAYKLPDGAELPDPASRWQPEGVHKPSAVFFPEDFQWTDSGWKGVSREDLVIYELHVGTFTPEGTFDAVIERLNELKDLGVTAIELMPVGQFAGERNWGYDGVYLYAAQSSYGGPRALQRLVDAAHQIGLAVFLDVVYNHLGPEGNYLGRFGRYFTDRYHTPWGDALNFDGPESEPVRRFMIDNACMWIRDFHLDGLRLDAVHAIYDFSARHILAELQTDVQQVAREQGRTVHVIAETNQNDVRLTDPTERHGYGLDGVWADDFHHCVRTLLAGDDEGYYVDFGEPEHLAKAFERVFVYDGCYSVFRRRRHGNPVGDRDRTQFVICIHNHDQVGNRALGDRSPTYLAESTQRLACGLLMLSPCVPMLFMGEEYAENRPFPFFCSFGDENLVESVRKGRREEFEALEFKWGHEIPDPQASKTFESAKLTWEWPQGSFHAKLRTLYADLLTARKTWPALKDRRGVKAYATAPSRDGRPQALVVERGEEPLIAVANLTADPLAMTLPILDGKTLIFSTEFNRYGGERDEANADATLLPHELTFWSSVVQ